MLAAYLSNLLVVSTCHSEVGKVCDNGDDEVVTVTPTACCPVFLCR